ncbi:hypothetical protein GGR56DRAFT_560454 [Xylariaceae sp. FL0804]|nr:hypothetical protein GGR56DRAFT_560454 [Xylariaceae sp. FL0804]
MTGKKTSRDVSKEQKVTVDKTKAAPVEHETIKPHQHEESSTQVDKDIHQDHYKHTIQPIHDTEVAPEKHRHQQGRQEERIFDERDDDELQQRQQHESSKFQNQRNVEDTKKTKTYGPTSENERVHHHIHETVQPVIKKQTIQPEVVHTTNKVHETHHKQAQHHGTTEAPPVSMSEFLEGRGAGGGGEMIPKGGSSGSSASKGSGGNQQKGGMGGGGRDDNKQQGMGMGKGMGQGKGGRGGDGGGAMKAKEMAGKRGHARKDSGVGGNDDDLDSDNDNSDHDESGGKSYLDQTIESGVNIVKGLNPLSSGDSKK